MSVLNLDKDFEYSGWSLKPEIFDFPSGCEPHIRLPALIACSDKVVIETRIKSMDDLMRLLLATDACRRSHISEIRCFIPYLPFARQDRVMVSGEPLSIKVLSDIINLQGYKEVTVFDVHSDVPLALIDNIRNIDNHRFVAAILDNKSDYFVISPDAGSYKKIFKLCQYLDYQQEVVLCNKVRDVVTGQITNVSCPVDNFEGKDLYIIDDICDGGGTFVLLADELRKRNCGKINLIVSHGIFSKGIEALGNIDHIYTTDSFQNLPPHEKLTQYKLRTIA